MDERPFLIALRVLGRTGIGLKPAPIDEQALRDSGSPRERKLPLEGLCYLILKRDLNASKKGAGLERRKLGSNSVVRMEWDTLIRKFSKERAELDTIIASLKQLQRSHLGATKKAPAR